MRALLFLMLAPILWLMLLPLTIRIRRTQPNDLLRSQYSTKSLWTWKIFRFEMIKDSNRLSLVRSFMVTKIG